MHTLKNGLNGMFYGMAILAPLKKKKVPKGEGHLQCWQNMKNVPSKIVIPHWYPSLLV